VRQAMLFLHILAGFALAAGNAAALAATLTARRASSPSTVLALMVLHRRSVRILVIPSAALVFLSGIYLTDAIGVGFGAPWIAGSLAAWALALLVGIVVLVPAQARAITTARQLVASGAAQPSATLRRHVGAWHIIAAEWAQQGLIVVFLALMVFRPA
jgi:hypothetical protein